MKAGSIIQRLAGCALAALLPFLPGCEVPEEWEVVAPGQGVGNVSVYRNVVFADIPIPPAYSLLTRESFSFQGSQFRTAVFRCEGALEWTRALTFFREEMPKAGWKQTRTDRGFTFRTLYFEKGPEQVIITVRQMRNGSAAEIQLDNTAQNDLLLKGRL